MIITATSQTISIRLEEQTFAEMLDSLARARAAVIALSPTAEPAPVTAAEPPALTDAQHADEPPKPMPAATPLAEPTEAPLAEWVPSGTEAPPAALIPGAEPTNDDEIVSAIMEFDALGVEVYGAEQWSAVSAANIKRITNGAIETPDELTIDQLNRLIGGLKRMKASATPQPSAGAPRERTTPPRGRTATTANRARTNGHSNRNAAREQAAQPSNVVWATG